MRVCLAYGTARLLRKAHYCAVCRIVQCNQRGVTPSETNIARLGWFRFHYFCLLHLLRHYPSGIQQKIKIKGTALRRTNLSHCNGTMGE